MELFNVYPLFDVEPVQGNGCYVYDKKGERYLDLYGGHAVISIGHSHPHYLKRISDQLHRISFYSNSVQNSLQREYAELLGSLSNCESYQLFLCNSGAEANENALKLASFHTGRDKIVAFKKAFHGRTSAAVNITDNPRIKAPINKKFEAEFHDWNNLDSVRASLKKGDVSAVIIEGIQGIGGIQVPDISFLKALRELCDEQGVILILDEIQSGFGRSGNFFAFQYADIAPDIISVAKGMGNGFPVGGILIHPEFEASYGLLGTTFGGNHLACAAGLAVLEVVDQEQLIPHAAQLGEYWKTELAQLSDIKEVRGKGLMIGLEFPFPVAELRKKLLYEEQIFTGSSSNKNVLRLLPPLNIQKEALDFFLEKLKKVLEKDQTQLQSTNY